MEVAGPLGHLSHQGSPYSDFLLETGISRPSDSAELEFFRVNGSHTLLAPTTAPSGVHSPESRDQSGVRGLSLVVMDRLLTAVASLVVEHRLWVLGFQ